MPEGTHGIGDTVGVAVTFNESVTVTATEAAKPRLMLAIGSESVWAEWKIGQGAGAVQRFEYAVAEGDLDTDGIAIEANSLETPSGSSIRTTDASEEVALGHASKQDAARPVDGVRPTATAGIGRGADGHGDLVGGARRGVGADGRGRFPGAHRQCQRPQCHRGVGLGLGDGADQSRPVLVQQ